MLKIRIFLTCDKDYHFLLIVHLKNLVLKFFTFKNFYRLFLQLCKAGEKPQELEANPKIPSNLEAIPNVEPEVRQAVEVKQDVNVNENTSKGV